MQRIRLTKTSVAALPPTDGGQRRYADDQLRGFGVIVGAKRKDGMVSKTYIVEREIRYGSRHDRRTVRVVVGSADLISAEQARDKAHKLLSRMRDGENPNITKRLTVEKAVAALTLDEALESYLLTRKTLKESTRGMYRYTVNKYLSDWKTKTLAEITKDEVAKRHAAIAAEVAKRQGDLAKKRAKKNGKATEGAWQGHDVANAAMKVVRLVYNHAKGLDDGLPENPVMRLSRTRAWYPNKRRDSVIPVDQLQAWHRAVLALENETYRDYLLTCLFTGLRRREAARMRWEDVNLNARTLLIPDTKANKPLVLPISAHLGQLLQARKPALKAANAAADAGGWVFPGDSESGHIEEPKFATEEVFKVSGVKATVHDLRRTFLTTAESLDISVYTYKRLVNHALPRDVTAGYINLSVERLRDSLEKITARLLQLINDPPKVVEFKRAET